MNMFFLSHLQGVRYEIILHRGVHLYDVPSFSSYIQIMDHLILQILGSFSDFKCMRSEKFNNIISRNDTKLLRVEKYIVILV